MCEFLCIYLACELLNFLGSVSWCLSKILENYCKVSSSLYSFLWYLNYIYHSFCSKGLVCRNSLLLNPFFSLCCMLGNIYWPVFRFRGLPRGLDGKESPVLQETYVWSLVGKISWRRPWQHTPVLLPGESHGQRSLVGYSPWGRKEPDMTKRLTLSLSGSVILSLICILRLFWTLWNNIIFLISSTSLNLFIGFTSLLKVPICSYVLTFPTRSFNIFFYLFWSHNVLIPKLHPMSDLLLLTNFSLDQQSYFLTFFTCSKY